tara:strand:+ start:4408 stop:5229 length:822 start_codon:yes stop_codon:yes gene_type:complete
MATDNILKLYSETIRSSYLHYGFWDKPGLIDPEKINLEELKIAQGRYIEHLSSFIPKGVRTILDVGCGIGGNAEYLIKKGYSIDTLSPDDFQKRIIIKKFKNEVKFHHSKFENFRSDKEFDLVLESESACYINMEKGFKKAKEIICDGGYLLVSDYFVHFNDGSKSLHLKSSHDMGMYLKLAKLNGFRLIKSYNQTDNTMPTLAYGKYIVDRFIFPSLDYGFYSAKKNYPIVSKIIKELFGKKIQSKKQQLDLLNTDLFRKYRKYMIYLFKKL